MERVRCSATSGSVTVMTLPADCELRGCQRRWRSSRTRPGGCGAVGRVYTGIRRQGGAKVRFTSSQVWVRRRHGCWSQDSHSHHTHPHDQDPPRAANDRLQHPRGVARAECGRHACVVANAYKAAVRHGVQACAAGVTWSRVCSANCSRCGKHIHAAACRARNFTTNTITRPLGIRNPSCESGIQVGNPRVAQARAVALAARRSGAEE